MINSKKTIPYSSKRLFILIISIVGVCFYFWTQSRYPALDKKALMGGRTSTGSIVFDILLPLMSGDTVVTRILKTTVNWYYTNWKGMTFGLIFSGLIVCTLSMFKFRGFKNRYLNALGGMVFGAPLGVCANCTAPISRSVYDTTKSIEATLSSLFSSPTFNFVVMTMAFQLLPFELAITKTILAILMILVVSPLLGRAFKDSPDHLKNLQDDADLSRDFPALSLEPKDVSSESWFSAFKNAVIMFLQGLYHICKLTLPTMLLAGFLGASIIEMVPLDSLINLKLSLAGILLVAAVGTFLPVPMSFDVVIVAILMDAGLHPVYGMILVFTLGIFSVYPFMVMWKTINLKFASSLFASVIIVGLMGAAVIPIWGQRNTSNLLAAFQSQDKDSMTVVMEATKKTCLTLGSPDKGDCVFQIANAINRKEICELLADKEDNKKCNAKYFGARLDTVKGEKCELLPNDGSREYCSFVYENQVYEEVHFLLPRTCEKNAGSEVSDICTNFDLFVKSRPITDCEKYKTPQQIRTCLNFLIKQRFFPAPLNKVDCSSLKTNIGQAFCRFIVGIGSKEKDKFKVKDEACGFSKNKEYQDYCNGFFVEAYANKFIQPEACEKINTEFKSKCRADSYARAASLLYFNQTKNSISASDFDIRDEGQLTDQASVQVKAAPILLKKEFTQKNISVSSFALDSKSGNDQFERLEGREVGIVLPDTDVVEALKVPFWVSRGMAAGDFDLDGRQDLVFATSKGPYLYKNLGGMKFQKISIGLSGISKESYNLNSVALVDINNDGYLDIYCSSENGVAYFLISKESNFANANRIDFPNTHNRFYVQTTAFGDVDKNGWLDLFVGNNPPWGLLGQSDRAENELILNDRLNWTVTNSYKDRILNLTMTSLLSDINQDGNLDLWLGTDLTLPDQLLMGKTGGRFSEIKKSQKIVPTTPDASMSYDSGDINNDLILDVFGVGVDSNPSVFFAESNYCDAIKNKVDKERCMHFEFLIGNITKFNPESCKKLSDVNERSDCFAALFGRSAVIQKDISLCNMIPETHPLKRNCIAYFSLNSNIVKYSQNSEDLSQANKNVLLVQNKKGTFDEVAKAWGVANTGWGWNSKFNDFNNDGWLDLYISTGFLTYRMISNNFLLINKEGKKFENKTKDSGIQELYSSFANVGIDLVNDGNMSIVATATNGPVRIYVNHSKNNSILFNLRQNSKIGNTSAIGARIIITNNEGASQIREVKASGGFLSFGPYVQHFGLGSSAGVKNVKIIWPDGEITNLQRPFQVNHQYVVERN